MAYSKTWDAVFEADPADVDLVSEGATRIREERTAIRERLEKDHYFAIAGTDAEHGEHVKVTFHNQSSTPGAEANKGFLYTKDVSAKAELFWEDEDGNEVQLTTGGLINYSYTPAAGAVIAWPTGTVPTGYLECNGASISRTTYAALFAVLSDDYGNVDGNTFNLPDYRGRFLRGWAHGQTTDPDKASRTDRGDTVTGDYVGTKQEDASQGHRHEVGMDGSVTSYVCGSIPNSGGASVGVFFQGGADNRVRALTMIADASNGTPRITSETRPTNTNIMYCIKY
jgi:microcystin-dependent protein